MPAFRDSDDVDVYEALENARKQVDALEGQLEEVLGQLTEYAEFEDEMEALAEDREALLDELGLTEHEWACGRGQRFPMFERPSVKLGIEYEEADDEDEGEVVNNVIDVDFSPSVVEDLPPLPPEALLEPVPPLPPIDSFSGDHRFLSNFWLVTIDYEGRSYPSTEHAYQAAKTFDTQRRATIAGFATAAEAKKVGRTIAIRSDWEQVKLQVMEDLLRAKFADFSLAEKLKATQGRDLIEGNVWGDVFWGVCRGEGKNHLGKLLMKIRDEIAMTPEPPPLPPEVLLALGRLPPPPSALAVYEPALEGVVEDTNGAAASGLFDIPAPPSMPKIVWTEEQHVALNAIDHWHDRGQDDFFSLTGPAGTGKTTLVREIVDRYPDAALAAMTGKAALRLSQLSGRSASTLHKILYYPPKTGEDVRFTKLREPESLFVIVDESSMCTPTVFRDLKQWARQGVRFLLVGDSYQLPPVITGEEAREFGEDYSVFAHVKGAELQTVMRNAGGVLRAATKVRETGEIVTASDIDENGGYEFLRCKNPLERAVEEYCADIEDHLLITWRNAPRMTANRLVRDKLHVDGPLPDDGEPVLIKKNGQGFLNGEIVICRGFEDGPKIGSLPTLWMKTGSQRILVSVLGGDPEKGGEFFDGSLPWVENWGQYHATLKRTGLPEPLPITWGYVLTCHAAQGGQAKRTTVFLCSGDDRNRNFRKTTTLPSGKSASFMSRWVYTATTRSVHRTLMITSR